MPQTRYANSDNLSIAYQVFGNRIQFYYVDILGLNAATATAAALPLLARAERVTDTGQRQLRTINHEQYD